MIIYIGLLFLILAIVLWPKYGMMSAAILQLLVYSTIFILIGRYFGYSDLSSLIYGWIWFAIIAYAWFAIGMTIVDMPREFPGMRPVPEHILNQV